MNDIKKIELISINVLKTSLSSIDNNLFIEELNSSETIIEKEHLEDKHQSYYEDRKYPFGKPEAEKLIIEITNAVNAAVGIEVILSEIWTVTLEKGQSVIAHTHKFGSLVNQEKYYSVAYYPTAPENSAELVFLVNACNTIEKQIIIEPKTGDLIIFNSYLMHMTKRHNNPDQSRIVVSANFHPKNPKIMEINHFSGYKP